MTNTTTIPALPAVGALASFQLESGDQYIGEIEAIRGDLITVIDYSVWYEGEPEPYSSPYPTDGACFRINNKTIVTVP
jgi:hypothetical protein